MRHWLLLVLVLLLTLRGWVGDAMAGQMLHQRAAPVAAQAVDQHQHAHSDATAQGHGHDCDQHAQAPAATGGAQPQSGTDCSTCASCQMCSSVGLAPPLAVEAPTGFSQPVPQTVQRTYASAEPALAFKPPRH
jgi:hypothetical protein